MRLLNVLPWALLVATTSLVTAHPVDNNVFASRADGDASPLARDLAGLDLLAREYISAVLFARTSPPERAQSHTEADSNKASRTWKLDCDLERARQKYHPGVAPIGGHFNSYEQYDKAWRKWDKQYRKFQGKTSKLHSQHDKKMGEEQRKHIHEAEKKAAAEKAAAEKAAAGKAKNPGTIAKWFGKGQKRGKRELMHVYDE
ncbi:hypothetical protein FOMPIDRAFT_1024726 [Fomitopsis schrenkii]|uniref:Uncharacterized protein n=1 Tax=Fomitopsis schrenkii TaxID=2126942 RepID=S8E004_FOMSC|nr:hypothetical protein FOMPIDRAFT_1024726 [Fomitopsis schrenkii]